MTYSSRVVTHLAKAAVNDDYLINTHFTYSELYDIAAASNQESMSLYISKEKIKPVREKKSRYVARLKLVDDGISYEERLEQMGYKPPDLTNIY